MSLSSIANTTLTANQAGKENSGNSVEQSEKRKVGLSSDNKIATFSDNVTLTESGSISNPVKIVDPDTLDSHSAGNLLKQVMKAIMTNSKDAVSAQANQSPQVAQTLLADK